MCYNLIVEGAGEDRPPQRQAPDDVSIDDKHRSELMIMT